MKTQNESPQTTPNGEKLFEINSQKKPIEELISESEKKSQDRLRLKGRLEEKPYRKRIWEKINDTTGFYADDMSSPKVSWNHFYDGRLKGRAPLAGIDRHRLGTDGKGVTTLVVFHGCPLRCKYCLNKQALEKDGIQEKLTPQELYERVKMDNLYFRATEGGITLGGGEPCLYSKFIVRLRKICNPTWKFTLETSLNVPTKHLQRLLPVIDYYIIDIKDMNSTRYRNYTGKDNARVVNNLKFLLAQGKSEQILVRVPLIPQYNTKENVDESIATLKAMGVVNIERFTYHIPDL